MSAQLFLNKYRPGTFADFENSDDIISIVKTLIAMDGLNILFAGGIGSGKTTFANAVVREYYEGISYESYKHNVLYINTLNDQGIHFYRSDVKTFCQTCSTIRGKKKIVVLDDIDIINEQSQQVFRNYIDKYGKNIHIICTCTNNQKVIETLQSRLTIIKIAPLLSSDLHNIAANIIHTEQMSITPDALDLIVRLSNNNVKVIIACLEKCRLIGQPIGAELVIRSCANINFQVFDDYTTLILDRKIAQAVTIFYKLYDTGYSVMDILDNYFLFVKTTYTLTELQKYNIIPFICKYIAIFHTTQEDEIELAFFTNQLVKRIANAD